MIKAIYKPKNENTVIIKDLGEYCEVMLGGEFKTVPKSDLEIISLKIRLSSFDELKENINSFGDLILLLPGVGAQGGDLEGIVKTFKQHSNNNYIVNVSRALLYADSSKDFAKTSKQILHDYNNLIQEFG